MEVLGLPRLRGPRLSVWRSSFAHPRQPHLNAIHTHWFNYKAEVFCPVVRAENGAATAADLAQVNAVFAPQLNQGRAQPRYWDSAHAPASVEEGDDPFFYLIRCQLVDLLHPNFIARYMKTGKFTAISIGSRLPTHNVAAIIPLGGEGKATLVLSVDKDTYEQLGLGGKHSVFKKLDRYNIHIDLCAPQFMPGKKCFERVRWCLMNRLTDVELLACWSVEGKTRKMEFPQAVTAQALKLKESQEMIKSLNVPVLEETLIKEVLAVDLSSPMGANETKDEAEDVLRLDESESDSEESEDENEDGKSGKQVLDRLDQSMKRMSLKGRAREKKSSTTSDEARVFFGDIHEYLGLISNFAIRGILSTTPTEEAHPFVTLDRFHQGSQAGYYEWRGLIATSFVEDLLNKARKLVNDKAVPWAALTVLGFEDSPVSWSKNEHAAAEILPGGENDYTFVILPNEQYWLFSAISKLDTYSG